MPKRKGPLSGTYLRQGVFWGRVKVKGTDQRFSLHTRDPRIAERLYKEEKERRTAEAYSPKPTRFAFGGVVSPWAKALVTNVGPRTATRYGVSMKRLEPFLDGLYLDPDRWLTGG